MSLSSQNPSVPAINPSELSVIDGQVTTTSLHVAEHFGKPHRDVLARIRALDCSPAFTQRNFSQCTRKGANNKPEPYYRMTRDGFTFLCMGFTGKRAAAWKEAYINAFNQLEAQLRDACAAERPLETLRTEVALVTQEHHVFIGSIRDNIVLAREDSSDAAVWAALSAVGARAWVERLPDGIDTRIGSGQQTLTPAQAQQVALARLIIADPHTLVLDEATSLIDPSSARNLEGAMAALLDGRAVIAIAHRLHTAHDADRIAVVDDGRIVELGAHNELLELDGQYAHLWRTWRD